MKTSANSALRAAAYIRVSSEEQTEGHSLDAQRRAIEAACADRGWTIAAWYADEGISAHTDDVTKRPAFHQMVQDAQRHQFDAVVVHKLDRFARSVVVALGTFKLLNQLGISFLSLSEQGMDFTTPMGKVMFGMVALLAEYYSENLGLETKKGKAERKAKGLHNGLVPFGYRSIDGGVAEPDPETKDGALLAFRLAAEGKSLNRIVEALNAGGYRPAGNMRRDLFTKDTVRDMLANQFYLGKLPVFVEGQSRRVREWREGQHAPLIDAATFTAARAAIQGRASATKTRRSASIYSLSGLLRCSHCGERMRAVRPASGRVRYQCRSKVQGLGCTGGGSFLDVYEAQLVSDLTSFTLPAEWQRHLLNQAGDVASRGEDVAQQRQQLEARVEKIKDLYSWGHLGKEGYLAEYERLERDLARVKPPEPVDTRLERMAEYVTSLPAAWVDADQEQRNQLANVLYEELWVDGSKLVYVKPRPDVEPLFQIRTGAAQPTPQQVSHLVRSGDPDGGRGRDCQHYPPVVAYHPRVGGRTRSLTSVTKIGISPILVPSIKQRVAAGESLRSIAREIGVSHECIRRTSQAVH